MKKNRLTAVIDIGSHSVRMDIGHVVRKGSFKVLERLRSPISIGNETFETGIITNATIRSLMSVLSRFKKLMDSYEVYNYRAVATSSLRSASNADVVVERVREATGIRIDIIEPLLESQIFHNGVCRLMKDRFGFQSENVLLFSIGGGTTQVIVKSAGNILFTETHNQGTLRLLRSYNLADKHMKYFLLPLAKNFSDSVKRYSSIDQIDRFIVLNDDILQVIRQRFPEVLSQGVFRVTKTRFEALAQEIYEMSIPEMMSEFSFNEQDSGTAKIAFLIVGIFYHLTGSKEVLFPDLAMAEAVLSEVATQNLEKGKAIIKRDKKTMENIKSAAHAIGVKYQYDEPHSKRVVEMALSIFDQLSENFNFSSNERLFLELSAELHDIGNFISAGEHHKHSYHLIASSEIMGLSRDELEMVALVARYHRKSMPKVSHPEYAALSRKNRMAVNRLAAILRVADSLDAPHTSWVQDLKIEMTEEECRFFVKLSDEGYGNIDILKNALKKKSDLFEFYFGVTVRLEGLL